ncbi:MAG: anti-sigma factor family protein [Planctomycetota bacterium]
MRAAHHHRRPLAPPRHGDDCDRLQADLSAMVDGELAPSAIRRVTAHADQCEACGAFRDSLRLQQQAHRALLGGGPSPLAPGLSAGGACGGAAARLAERLGAGSSSVWPGCCEEPRGREPLGGEVPGLPSWCGSLPRRPGPCADLSGDRRSLGRRR